MAQEPFTHQAHASMSQDQDRPSKGAAVATANFFLAWSHLESDFSHPIHLPVSEALRNHRSKALKEQHLEGHREQAELPYLNQ